jgi:bifunctional ADP-heptose synthase (sugar kinase/adenylyltransferase)
MILDAIRTLRIAVIGEAIRDEYSFCRPLGMSPKDVLVTWRQDHEEAYEGGATAVANHVRAFSPHVGEITQDVPLIKRRYVFAPFLQKIFAVEHVALDGADAVAEGCADLRRYDVVIAADYGHGLFTESLLHRVADGARFLAVMAQTNSANIPFNPITRWPRADYACLDEFELRLAMCDRDGHIGVLAGKLRAQLDARMVAVTRGHLGSLVVDVQGMTTTPAVPGPPVDRMGAGDAFLAITAPLVALGASRDDVGRIGNAAGALAVRTVGHRTPITREALEALL